ncbi:helix-turn-helix domain-containing protein [Nocardia amikacinitolerans]|uniref:helix-turn-helix domain-containing protein n=1 Tax=Nocardia amikacinitolerans TaxID=756689 RepID=UPI0020A49A06|nr:helix-turn-helix domain-containing protein [Nocardia amikacinitolerans]
MMRKAPPTLVRGAFAGVDLLGRYSKQDDSLSKVIERLASTAPRRPAKTSKMIQVRRLDQRLSAAMIAELTEAYRSGTSTPKLCEQYKLSKGGILKLLRGAGVELRKQPMTDEQAKLAAKLYGEGLSPQAIGAQLGKAKSSVRGALIERGVVIRPAANRYRKVAPS